jgi:organic hydroperoxide reductase OsmC/OhrA
MHMRNQVRRVFRVLLRRTDRYQFVSQASEDGRVHGPPFLSDEPDPVGDAAAPSTPALLGAAIGHCLSASLLEALKHAHVDVREVETDVASVVAPNSEGLPRVHHIDVVIRPLLGAPSPRVTRCEEVFERHCTVTSSVRQGIDVAVQVQWRYAAAPPDG